MKSPRKIANQKLRDKRKEFIERYKSLSPKARLDAIRFLREKAEQHGEYFSLVVDDCLEISHKEFSKGKKRSFIEIDTPDEAEFYTAENIARLAELAEEN